MVSTPVDGNLICVAVCCSTSAHMCSRMEFMITTLWEHVAAPVSGYRSPGTASPAEVARLPVPGRTGTCWTWPRRLGLHCPPDWTVIDPLPLLPPAGSAKLMTEINKSDRSLPRVLGVPAQPWPLPRVNCGFQERPSCPAALFPAVGAGQAPL